MALSLKEKKSAIQNFFDLGGKGVFVCAGAYLATNCSDIYVEEYKTNLDNVLSPLDYMFSSSSENLNLNIVSNYKSMGPFIPNNTYALNPASFSVNIKKPYCVTLALENNQSLKQMYIGGCGFKSIDTTNTGRVVATYHDLNSYSFFRPDKVPETIVAMPAIIQMKEKHILLSGPHIETCVEDSKLLKLIQDGNETMMPISEKNEYDAASSRDFVVPLLRSTLAHT